MGNWDASSKTYINVTDDDVAKNLVRDLFLDRKGEMTVGEWQELWANAGSGILHTSLGRTALITPQLADKALRHLMEGDHPFCVVEDEQRLVWPIQKAMAQ